MLPPLSSVDQIERVVREEWGRILAIMVKNLGDFQLAEDCMQDALIAAMQHWEKNGMPRSPAAWLLQVARRRAIDRIRRDQNFAAKQAELSYLYDLEQTGEAYEERAVIPDERLQMIFICCHPILAEKSRIALTLRALGGLNTEQIAAAFLDSPEAMQRRITRAKHAIADAGLAYREPEPSDVPERLHSVLRTLYLIFNEGYSASSGAELTRVDLSDEAIRLVRIAAQLMPEECEVQGLQALMLLHDSRRHARVGPNGELITLEHQNRARWSRAKIEEGTKILQSCLPKGRPGPYQVQAAISGVHANSPDWEHTDWAQIVELYEVLMSMEATAVVELNHAVALCLAGQVEKAQVCLTRLANSKDMQKYVPFHSARAEVFKRLGQDSDAKAALQEALALVQNEAEATFLRSKLAELG